MDAAAYPPAQGQREDLQLLYPGRTIEDFAAQALARGAPWVVVTRGAAGAVAFSACGQVPMPPQRTSVVDTVGAGDTFQAALLTWLAETGRLSATAIAALDIPAQHEALAFAARAAALTCSRRGADLPRRAELGRAPALPSSAPSAPSAPPGGVTAVDGSAPATGA